MTAATSTPAVILFVSSDLFLGSRVTAAIRAAGRSADVAASGAAAGQRLSESSAYRLVIVDLETPGLQIDALLAARQEPRPAVIAYGPHVQVPRLQAARQAGCDLVLTRGQFDGALPELLSEWLS
jgi:CheY-like chemotaxis protein